jgi:hypothetical protein
MRGRRPGLPSWQSSSASHRWVGKAKGWAAPSCFTDHSCSHWSRPFMQSLSTCRCPLLDLRCANNTSPWSTVLI